jgi:2-methylcitrate dehydratase PrpD
MHHSAAGTGFVSMIDWLETCEYDDIPADVVAVGKKCLLDGLACILAGLHAQPIAEYRDVLALNSVGDNGPVPVGDGRSAGLFDAANLYAHASNMLDLDDCYRYAPSHPGATIIGPALACAHVLKRSGRDTLAAIIKAYEASLRIGASLCPSDAAPSKDIGYATWQIFGAYISAGLLLGLDRAQWTQGFGLAAQQAPLPMIVRTNPEGNYTWLKNTYGAAAHAGVMSAFLAQRGYVGDQHFFDEEFGFWKTYGTDRFRPECLNDLPGEQWLIRDVEFKPWASCRWSHPALEAILDMKPELDLRKLQSIDIHAFKEFCGTLDSPYPATLVDAQFNVRFLVAVALVHDDLNSALRAPDFESATLRDLFGKIHVHHDIQLDAVRRSNMSVPTRVVVKVEGEATRERFITEPPGSGRRGIADLEQIRTKCRDILGSVMPVDQADSLIEQVMSFEQGTANALLNASFPTH